MIKFSKLHIITIALISSILLGVTAYYYHQTETQTIRKEKYDYLNAIAMLKIDQITKWKNERISEAKFFPAMGRFIKSTAELSSNSNNPEAKDFLLKTLIPIKERHSYDNMLITDLNHKILFSINSTETLLDSITIAYSKKSTKLDTVIYSDFYYCNEHFSIHLDLLSPIKDNNGNIIGTFISRFNPKDYLFPLIQKWPTPNKTAESLIFKKEKGEIRILNEVKSQPNQKMSITIPLTDTNIVAVKGALGATGIVEGKDYRGADVLADLHPIPGTDWYLISKIDKDEIYSDLFFRGRLIFLLTLAVVLLIVAGAMYLNRLNQSITYKNLFLKEKELSETREEFQTTLYSIGDAVITTDASGNIKYMNSVAEQLTGWSERESKGEKLTEVFKIVNEDSNVKVENPVERVLRDGTIVGLANHTLLISKDGKQIPIADSGSPIKDSDNKIIGVVLVFRDQTDERNNEKTLLESNEKFSKIFNSSSDSISLTKINNGEIVECNEGFEKMFGYNRSEILGKSAIELGLWDKVEERNQIVQLLKSNGHVRNFEAAGKRKNGKLFTGLLSGEIVKIDNETLILLTVRDISERKEFEEKLKTNEEKYRMLLDFASDAFFQGDTHGNFITVNNKAVELTGYSKDELLKMNMQNLFSNELLETIPLRYDRLLAGETIKIERVVVKKDGKSIYVEMTSKQMPDGTFQSFIRDVSEIKIAEKEFRESEERFRKAFITSPDSININRLSDGRYVSINSGFTKVTGYTEEEVIGKTSAEIQIWADISYRNALVEKLKSSNLVENFEAKFRIKDGRFFDGLMSAATIELNNEPHIISITRDITERKRFEAALRNEKDRISTILNLVGDPIFVKDEQHRFTLCNKAFYEMVGLDEEDVIGKTLAENIPDDEMEHFLKVDRHVLESGIPDTCEEELTINNKTKTIITRKTRFIDDSGNRLLIGSMHDITDRINAEKEKVHLNDLMKYIISNTKSCVSVFDTEMNYIYVSDRYFDDLHLADKNIIGRNHYEVFPDLPQFLRDIHKRSLNGETISGENDPLLHSDGSMDWANWKCMPWYNTDRIIGGIIIYIEVITERKKAEEEALKTKFHYQKLIENAPDGIVEVTAAGEFKYVSPSAKKIFGYPIEKRVEQSPNELTHPDDLPFVLNTLSAIIKNPEMVPTIEYRFSKNDGNWVWIESTFTNLLNEPSVDAIVINFRDITDRKRMEEAVQHSETKFYSLFENSPNAIFITDPDSLLIIDCNANACSMNGYTREELIGKSINILHPQNVSDLLTNSKLHKEQIEILRQHKSVTVESVHKRKDGTIFPIESSISLISLSGKEVTMGIDRDITDRKKSDDQLRKLFRAVEQSPATIVITDIKGDIEYVNPKFEETTGYAFEEVMGKNPRILSSGNMTKEDYAIMWETILSGKEWRGEFYNKKKNGEYFWESASISPITDSNNNITHIVALKEDITEKKIMLEQLSKSEEEFRTIWENSVDAMRLIDENGVIINVNDSYCKLFGLSKTDLIGYLFNVSYTVTDNDNSLIGYKERFKNRTILRKFETEIILKSGRPIWVELTNSFIDFEDKNLLLLSIIRDTTDKKQMINELTEAKEKAEEMVKLKSYFFANMSHELRTPFVGILGFAEILKDTLKDRDEKEYAEQILKSSKRLTDTLNKILNLTRLEFDKVEVNKKEFNVCKLLKSVEQFYFNSAKLNNTILKAKYTSESISVISDPKLLEDILTNLVNNAVKFTYNGNIIISASKELNGVNERLLIKVQDTGIGIPKEKQNIIWQEFRQASEGFNRSFEGTGLGLSITKKYVELLNGEISLDSVEGKGTTFLISLPLENEKIEKFTTEEEFQSTIVKDPIKQISGKPKLLYVEDDAVALQFIGIVLKSGYEVETAFKANIALELVAKKEYDILMLDINLGSGMDGVELMQKIREIEYYKNIPIVAVTAYAADSDKAEFLTKGFSHYISKPFTQRELLALLKLILGAN